MENDGYHDCMEQNREIKYENLDKEINKHDGIKYEIDDKWLHRGQEVIILNKYFNGQRAIVEKFMWNTGEYLVIMPNGHKIPFRPSELGKIL